MRSFIKNVSFNHNGFSKTVVDCLLAFILLIFSSELFAFTFTSTGAATTAPNCTGGYGGVYTCTNGFNNFGNFTTINNSAGPVTINITGNMAVNENISVSSEVYPVTFNVEGSVSVGGFGVAYNLSNSATNVTFYVRDNVTLQASTIKASIFTRGNGNIALGNTVLGPTIVGDIDAYNGTIGVYGRVIGCVKSHRGNAGDILLGDSNALVDGVNCASNGSNSCVTNNSGHPTPSYCTQETLIAEYHLDEVTWNGTTDETKDTAGLTTGPFHGQGIGTPKPTSQASNPARSGVTGTCSAAKFTGSSSGSAFTLDNLPVKTTGGAKTSVSFWMYWDGASTPEIPIGWNKYNLVFGTTSFGFNTYEGDVFGISSSGLGGGWHHVVAVFTNGNVSLNELYIDGTKRTLSQLSSSPNNANAVVQSTLKVGGITFDNNFGFDGGRIDEVKIYNGAISQSQVTAEFNATHYCIKLLPPEDNLALTANVTTSYSSAGNPPENTKDNITSTSSSVYKYADGGIPVYGNWRGSSYFGESNWVEYSWPTDKRLTEFKVFWWDDSFKGGETIQPTVANVEYWNGTAWVNLGSIGTTLNTFNSLLINNIVTKKIRVAMSSAKATGIIEVRIFGIEAFVNANATGFNCTVVGGASDTGHLNTQVAGTPFSIDVIALKSTGATETDYVQSGTKNVTLEIVGNYDSVNSKFTTGAMAAACSSLTPISPAVSQTVVFDATNAGRKTVTGITIGKAYRDLRCRVTDANPAPNVVGCSSDDFAVRPSSLTVTTSNANADGTGTSTTLTPKIKAGANFSLTATADVVGYDGTPAIDASKLSAHATGAIQVGSLSGSFGTSNPSTSLAIGAGFNYSEVGYFRFGANGVYDSNFTSVDSGNGDCATGFVASGGLNACSFGNTVATSYFGRFIPDHFAVTPTSVTPACSNLFTYFGQDGVSTAFTLFAQNSANATTQNYTGNFAKLGLNAWASYNFSAAPLPTDSIFFASATAPTGGWINGNASVVAKHQVSRPSAATATTGIIISAAPVDSDGVTMPTTAVSASSNFRYGRLYMPNTYGPELLPLSVSIEAQYWNGTAYQRNQQDSCSQISANSIAMGNYKSNLNACETVLAGGGTMSAGKTTVTLSKPGNGNNGSVDLTVNLNGATANTCNSATQTAALSASLPWFGTTNLSSRATFGLFKTPVIYMRENF